MNPQSASPKPLLGNRQLPARSNWSNIGSRHCAAAFLDVACILDDIEVRDFTRVIAEPQCTQLLSDMRATVYRIDKPGEGDDTRHMRPLLHDAQDEPTAETVVDGAFNHCKQSVTVDIPRPVGAAPVRAVPMLGEHADDVLGCERVAGAGERAALRERGVV